MYAIVRSGGTQHKVAVGDTITTNRVATSVGGSLTLPAVLVVDADQVTADPAELARVVVSAEVVAPARGPKIKIWKHRNKTGYTKRQGHRQELSVLKVTGIEIGK